MGHNASIAPAAGTGAALLRPRCRYGRCAAAALHIVVPRSTCNVQPSPPSRLAPHPLAPRATSPRAASPRATAPLRPSTLSSHVQRATFNLQPLSPHPLSPLPSLPLASRLAPLPHERWRIVIQRLVELTRRPMTGKHRLRNNVRRLGITNHPQGAYASGGYARTPDQPPVHRAAGDQRRSPLHRTPDRW
jgi:hypothetical protein